MAYITTVDTAFYILVALQVAQFILFMDLYKSNNIRKQLIVTCISNTLWIVLLGLVGYFISLKVVTTFLFACTVVGLPVGFCIGFVRARKLRKALNDAAEYK